MRLPPGERIRKQAWATYSISTSPGPSFCPSSVEALCGCCANADASNEAIATAQGRKKERRDPFIVLSSSCMLRRTPYAGVTPCSGRCAARARAIEECVGGARHATRYLDSRESRDEREPRAESDRAPRRTVLLHGDLARARARP